MYPETCGYRDNNTSKESAKRKQRSADSDRALILSLFKSNLKGYTAHQAYAEIAHTGISLNSTRSRMTELKDMNLLVKTTEKIYDSMGYPSAVYYYKAPMVVRFDEMGQGTFI